MRTTFRAVAAGVHPSNQMPPGNIAGKETSRTRTRNVPFSPPQAPPRRRKLRPVAAGTDPGATVHSVAVPAERDSRPVCHFGTLTGVLTGLTGSPNAS